MVYLLLCGLWHYSVELVNTSELSATLVFSIVDLFWLRTTKPSLDTNARQEKLRRNYNVWNPVNKQTAPKLCARKGIISHYARTSVSPDWFKNHQRLFHIPAVAIEIKQTNPSLWHQWTKWQIPRPQWTLERMLSTYWSQFVLIFALFWTFFCIKMSFCCRQLLLLAIPDR